MAYWVQVQPLGALLGRAIDGGEPLDTNLWHSFRPPVFHRAAAVQEIYAELKRVWDSTQQELPLSEDDWYGMQIKEIVGLFGWAESRQEAVVSILSLPFDNERAPNTPGYHTSSASLPGRPGGYPTGPPTDPDVRD